MAILSFAYPEKAIDLGDRVKALPEDYGIPGMNGWRWIHTLGHADGQVSLFQDEGCLLIAGDAFVTVQQESLYKVGTQKEEVHGPPSYFTPDWIAAEASVRALAALHPTIAATGHGTPMSGDDLARGLTNLVENFDEIAVPEHGRYVP
jgi:glyoxylase-like metal-dependent hydrolase (beta-lactamase superfamily II)